MYLFLLLEVDVIKNNNNMYNLHLLGWYGFQELCNSITREIWTQTAMIYAPSKDGGRDGSFQGKWLENENNDAEKQCVIQCKFTSKQNSNLKASDLSDEIEKIKKLVDQNLCDIYIIMTNASVSGVAASKIQIEFEKLGIKKVLVYGSEWICAQIRESTRLRRLVPRVYGLGDLTQILDERVYKQGASLLTYLKEDLSKVVITSAYNNAVAAIEKHNFVLLIGEPAAGKTTIASLLAMGALDQWKASTLKLDTADQVIKHWNPDDAGQFFWIDDAFGVTQYEFTLSQSWNQSMSQIKAMLHGGARIVMTSRDYIYNAARKDLKTGAFPLLNESNVVIDVNDLGLNERRQILYNHIKLGKQPIGFKRKIKPHLETISNNVNFTPETARRLADPFFTKNVNISEYSLGEFVNKQENFLLDVVTELDKNSQAALGLIYMNKEKLKSPLELTILELNMIQKLGSSLNGCIVALEAMKGNLVRQVSHDDELIWKYKHPTIGDAFANYVATSSELLEIYIQGSELDNLFNQVTCGDVGIKKSIQIPKSLFPILINKLSSYKTSSSYKSAFYSQWYAKKNLFTFLSNRCSLSFLKLFLEKNPHILDETTEINLDIYRYSHPELDLACTLVKYDLMPDEYRQKIIQKISDAAKNGKNYNVLISEEIQLLFSKNELKELRSEIETALEAIIPTMKDTWATRFKEDEDPEYHMTSLLDNLETIESEFSDVIGISDIIEKERENISQWIKENIQIEHSIPERETLSAQQESKIINRERSIFDDIDK